MKKKSFITILLISLFLSSSSLLAQSEARKNLYKAIQSKNLSSVKNLLPHAGDIDVKVAQTALYQGTPAILEAILNAGLDSNANLSPSGDTLLFAAVSHGASDMVEVLIKKKANVNHKNERGETPLMRIAGSRSYSTKEKRDYAGSARLILKAGAKVEDTDGNGETALSHAIEAKNIDVAKVLMAYGSNPLLKHGGFSATIYETAEKMAPYSSVGRALFDVVRNGAKKSGEVKILSNNKSKPCKNPDRVTVKFRRPNESKVRGQNTAGVTVSSDGSCQVYLLQKNRLNSETFYSHHIITASAAEIRLNTKTKRAWKDDYNFRVAGLYENSFKAYGCQQIEKAFNEPCGVIFPTEENMNTFNSIMPHRELEEALNIIE